ncbi:MAG: N-acetylmuramoyl-L-alanine amidase [Gemmatimonadota bacterium]|nr:N-acetylmuramoyl-L-alanine amidase [Gemmatimonadota bacterium]MDH3366423.1 N-acetylmuramoyl-L-alanine amidase [Gemmatimonadota bacterium]MDH3478967.1 N-acetylmuramoyl-L-alanine amidase [Gemmatimonadota bacterium]MDH3570018.1 N-acetylmuramoyl-L-alanine amidase [Gemmatimonadota bacterium]MDH5551270.1 N-acetylmuramoyl-L-alanine amidase [Gemmatimonadota bacterium]
MRLLLLTTLTLTVHAAPVVAPPVVPRAVVIATARGETAIPVGVHKGHAALPVSRLGAVLPVTSEVFGDWALVAFAGEPFRFLLGAPLFVHDGRVVPVAGGAYIVSDTLFVPLQWLAEFVPRIFSEGYRYDPRSARFEETRMATRTPSVATPAPGRPGSDAARRNGLRLAHRVVVDPGHGGVDPGNPGRHLPGNMREKHVNLAIGLQLRDELRRRGVDVIMTRSTDTLIALGERALMCRDECDLFVSIHVNSLPARRGYERVDGAETYFLGEALTAEARRVAAMENEALRYETGGGDLGGDLGFIFKDLQTNEFLRESALLADIVQHQTAATHPGQNRGVAQAPYVVLKTATRPAILVETGFATNRRDGEFLASKSGQQAIARSIAEGVVEYLKRYEAKVLVGTQP